MKFGNNIDLDWNQLQNARLQNLSSVPISKDSAEEGYIYYNTAQHRAQLYVKKVSGNSVVIDDWYNLLLGRENEIDPSWLQGGIGIGKLGCVLKDSDTNYLNSFAADENNLIPTTGAIYGFFKDALKRNDAMVYMGTFTGQASTSTTVSASSFTLSAAYGGGSPTALTNFNGLSKGAMFKVVAPATNPPATMYFGNIKVEAGDMIIVGEDFTSSATTAALSKFDLIQLNLTNYVTTFGGRTGAITVRGVDGVAESTTVGDVNFTLSNGLLAGTVVRDTPVLTWEEATSNAPTLKVKAMGNTSAAMTVPAAGETRSGVVTTGDQIFAGEKTFLSMVTLKRPFEGQNYDILAANHRNGMLYFRAANVEIASNIVSTAWHFYPVGYRNDGTADVTTMYPMQIAGLSGTSAPTGGLFFTGDKTYCGADNSFFWGVNTRNPQYRLHVNGTFGAGNTTISGTLGVTGATTLGSTLGVADVITLSGAQSNSSNHQKIQFGTGNNIYGFLEVIDLGSGNTPRYALRCSIPFYSDSWVASGGIGSGSGGSGGGSNIQLLNLSQCRSLASESAGSGKAAAAWAIKQLDTDYSSKYNNLVSSINTLRQDVNSISASGVVSVSLPTASNTGYLVTSVTKASDSTAISVTKVDIGSYSLTLNGGTAVSLIKTSSGNSSASFYAPTSAGTEGQYLKSSGSGAPTWGDVTNLGLGLQSLSSANAATTKEGLEVYRTISSTTGLPAEPTNHSGSLIEWCRYVEPSTTLTSSKRNGAVQLYVPHTSGRLFFRNSWGVASDETHEENEIVWNDWLEVATIGNGGNSCLIKSYKIKRSGGNGTWEGSSVYKVYNLPYDFYSDSIVVALYDSETNGNLVMTDVTIIKDTDSSSSTYNKYGVKLSFAKAFGSSDTYRLVVYGK